MPITSGLCRNIRDMYVLVLSIDILITLLSVRCWGSATIIMAGASVGYIAAFLLSELF
jgi:hypothetical protein